MLYFTDSWPMSVHVLLCRLPSEKIHGFRQKVTLEGEYPAYKCQFLNSPFHQPVPVGQGFRSFRSQEPKNWSLEMLHIVRICPNFFKKKSCVTFPIITAILGYPVSPCTSHISSISGETNKIVCPF